jgi:putrescine aminotransferase
MHAQGGLPIPGITHIQQPCWWTQGRPLGLEPEAFGLQAAQWLEQRILELGPENVAAFIGEPIQGAGGVIIPPASYWPENQRISERYGILLVSDEVICDFGRTGHWFGCETFGFTPDLMTFAKGVTSGYVPLGGVMVGERVARVLIEQGGEFAHGYTYSGHPVACAVGQAQTCGLMGALVLVQDKARGTAFPGEHEVGMVCRKHCFANGLVMRAVGDRMIIAPPLVITRAQIDEMIELIHRCLDLTLEEVRRNGWGGG